MILTILLTTVGANRICFGYGIAPRQRAAVGVRGTGVRSDVVEADAGDLCFADYLGTVGNGLVKGWGDVADVVHDAEGAEVDCEVLGAGLEPVMAFAELEVTDEKSAVGEVECSVGLLNEHERETYGIGRESDSSTVGETLYGCRAGGRFVAAGDIQLEVFDERLMSG